jgi:hypothetical protein
MPRSVVAVITGFTKTTALVELSLAPVRRLKASGIIDRILYVTWDDPAIDPYLAPLASMLDVELVRIPQPQVKGIFHEKTFTYQRRNFAAALAMVPDPDALIVKLRPDFIFDDVFLASKIVGFDVLCAPSNLDRRLGISMPRSPFSNKIWIPWADANQPFFFEDGEFIGLRSDVAQLQPDVVEELIRTCGDAESDWSGHILRYIAPFLDDYPILRRYLAELRYFVKDTDYRDATLGDMVADPYFWCLVVTNAWILATSFHVDCGTDGQMKSYPNRYLAMQGDTPLDRMEPAAPYDAIAEWRKGESPGGMTPCILRKYGRLMDDRWQTSLFTVPVLRDLPRDNLIGILNAVRCYKDGVLNGMEDAFYATMRNLHETHWIRRAA